MTLQRYDSVVTEKIGKTFGITFAGTFATSLKKTTTLVNSRSWEVSGRYSTDTDTCTVYLLRAGASGR